MKFFLSMAAAVLLLTTQSGAETYSWVDDSGTYNFTEDFSKVPKKYRKKVNRLGEMGGDGSASLESPSPEKKTDSVGAPAPKSYAKPVEDKQLYNGKSRETWRQELEAHEAELTKLEQHLDLLYKQSAQQPGLFGDQFAALKKEYDDTKATYDQKYKVYSELIESAQKAGLTIEMKK